MVLLKVCKENKNYLVDDQGNIFNKDMYKMKQYDNGNGYLLVCLWNGKKHDRYYVHRLVANNFLRRRKGYTQVNHKNGLKGDNRLENLEWISVKLNNIHALNTGLRVHGEKCSFSKLTEIQVKEIRQRYVKGVITYVELSKIYGVCKQQIERIVNNKRWTRTK